MLLGEYLDEMSHKFRNEELLRNEIARRTTVPAIDLIAGMPDGIGSARVEARHCLRA
ncbi:hypothetical protein [Burkholderia sp. Bp9031]|uniref:hypothetical protein n=1 Tax=Burkholderia sp. Bp9031 TaxID=2184566 RepID=UPI000AB7721C|nr:MULTISPECIES: hypothetical protein [Burkholderia]